MKKIKGFYFQNAKYLVTDEEGDSLFMVMNYKDNSFKLETISGENVELKNETESVALKLLAKKHGVNFVSRLEI